MTINLLGISSGPSQPRWTEPEDAVLRAMWDARNTAKEIAEYLGKSRNAVIGRVHRLGLAARPSPIAGRVTAPRIVREPHIQRGPLKRAEIRPELISAPQPIGIDSKVNKPVALSLHGTCQWIPGDPRIDPTKCGARAQRGSSWCPEHYARCYRPVGSQA